MNVRSLTLRTLAISVLIHLAAILSLWNADLVGGRTSGLARADEAAVEFDILPAAAKSADANQPTAYTDIPERAATTERPERADFLALHNSRAADAVPGGTVDAKPAATHESPVEQVAIERENLASDPGVVVTPLAGQTAEPAAARRIAEPLEAPQSADVSAGTAGQEPYPDDLDAASPAPTKPEAAEASEPFLPELRGSAPSILKQGSEGPSGDKGFDFDQLASGHLDGNVLESGGFQLNTWEWNWAPWMQQFGQSLRRHWVAPYAYSLGVIDGMTRLKVVIERDGRCSQLEVEDAQGHESLQQASVAAVTAAAPFAPLPQDFPEPNLVIILSLYYPAWKAAVPASTPQPTRPQRRGR